MVDPMQTATLSSQNTPVDLSRIINRDPGRAMAESRQHESVTAPIGDRDSASGGDQGKKQAFGKELFDQPAAPGTERKPHSHFMSAQQ